MKNLLEKFEPLKHEDSNFMFKQLWNVISTSDEKIYTDEDIIGICVMQVIKKCNWLNEEDHFCAVSDFVKELHVKLNENKINDRQKYNQFVNAILGNTWGGKREGSGRPSTGRSRNVFYITENENTVLKKYLAKLRSE